MQVRTQYWAPTVIFLIGFCLHLSLISKGPVTIDCLDLVIKSQTTIATHQLQYLFGSGYPLMVMLGAVFISIGKCIGITDPVLAVNFISVVFSSIAILAFYLLVQEICNDTLPSIIASLMLLLNPLFLDVSTYGINHAPALCFLLLGLLSLLRFQRSGKISGLLLSILYFGLMGATRLQDLIFISPAIAYLFINKYKTKYFILFVTSIILIILLFHLPYFIYDHTNYAIQAKYYWKTGFSENFRGLFSRPFRYTLMYLYLAFSIVGAFYFVVGSFYIAKFKKGLSVFNILWWIVPLFFLGNNIISAPRFLIVLLPAIIIPISIFLTHLIRDKRMMWKAIAIISFLTILFQPLLSTKDTFIRRHQYALISDYYRWVGQSTPPDATIISGDDGLFIGYYSKRKTLPKPVSTAHLSPKELNDFKEKLDIILENEKPVYITNTGFTDYDRYREFRNLMRQNYRLIDIGQKPLELWYVTPINPQLHMSSLVKVEKKN